MKLDDFLKANGITGAQFAKAIGVDAATVFRIRTGRVFPHRRTMQAIIRATGGKVSAKDMFDTNEEIGGHD